MNSEPRLSIAVPIHNEAAVLEELLLRIRVVLDRIPGGPHQILFVDDGSTDTSLPILEQAAHSDPRITVIALSRNFGHQAALSAALDHISGDAVILMDGDLQDEPETIPLFVDRFKDGYDVVYAIRAKRRESWALKICYFAFYRFQALLSNTRFPLDAGDFGLMSRRVVNQIREMPEHQRYLRGLRAWVGFRQIGVPIERAQRSSGQSKYSALKLLQLASDGIFAFSVIPLRVATLFGALAVTAAGLFTLYSLFAKFFLHRSPQGFTALVVLITFLAGVLLFSLGIIGEYVGRIYEEIKARPQYVVSKIVNAAGAYGPSRSNEYRQLSGGSVRES